jgi:hypothetical protein
MLGDVLLLYSPVTQHHVILHHTTVQAKEGGATASPKRSVDTQVGDVTLDLRFDRCSTSDHHCSAGVCQECKYKSSIHE